MQESIPLVEIALQCAKLVVLKNGVQLVKFDRVKVAYVAVKSLSHILH